MRIDKIGAIVLSRRNLLTLLHKLDMQGSERTIYKTVHDPVHDVYRVVVVKCEDDEEHYKQTAYPTPGRMHPETEKYIQDHAK